MPLIKEGATSADCTVTSDMIPPLTILHEPTAGDSPAHSKVVALSVSLEEGNFRGNSDGLVVHHSAPEPESAPRLIYEPGCQCVLYLYQTSCSGEWELWAQPPVQPWDKVHPYFLSLSCYSLPHQHLGRLMTRWLR